MKKLILIPLLALSLIACTEPNTTTPGHERIANKALALTKGLEDCTLFEFDVGEGEHKLNIVRCPNSTVSTNQAVSSGKTTRQQTVVTIDGVDYAPIEKTN